MKVNFSPILGSVAAKPTSVLENRLPIPTNEAMVAASMWVKPASVQ